jgi:hypothetical protein
MIHANWLDTIQTTHRIRETTTCEHTMHVLWRAMSHRYQLPQETTIIYNLNHFHLHATSWRLEKWGCLVSIRTTRLDSDASYVQNSPNLLLDLTSYFLSPIMIKYGTSMTMEIETLLDFSASMCFINKELVWRHKMIIVIKKHTSSCVGH